MERGRQKVGKKGSLSFSLSSLLRGMAWYKQKRKVGEGRNSPIDTIITNRS